MCKKRFYRSAIYTAPNPRSGETDTWHRCPRDNHTYAFINYLRRFKYDVIQFTHHSDNTISIHVTYDVLGK